MAMPDLGKSVDYEFLYDLELIDPPTDKPTGVHFKIRSAASQDVRDIIRKHLDANIGRRLKGKTVKASTLERQELEKAASYVASWDWGDNTFEGVVPQYSIEKVIEILNKKAWILEQVLEAANDVSNFS
jgi:hypothetical protein